MKCSQCKNTDELKDIFVFEGKNYCMDCLYPLIIAMCESGIVNIDLSNYEDNGMLISG